MKIRHCILLAAVLLPHFGTTFILKENGVEIAQWTEEDGLDEVRVIQSDEGQGGGPLTQQAEPAVDKSKNKQTAKAAEKNSLMDREVRNMPSPIGIQAQESRGRPVAEQFRAPETKPRVFSYDVKMLKKSNVRQVPRRTAVAEAPPPQRPSSSRALETANETRSRREEEPAQETVLKTSSQMSVSLPNAPLSLKEWGEGREAYQHGLRIQNETGKPLLLYFCEDENPYCKRYERDIINDQRAQKYLADFVKVKISPEAEKGLAKKYRVKQVPAFYVQKNLKEYSPIFETSSPVFFVKEISKTLEASR